MGFWLLVSFFLGFLVFGFDVWFFGFCLLFGFCFGFGGGPGLTLGGRLFQATPKMHCRPGFPRLLACFLMENLSPSPEGSPLKPLVHSEFWVSRRKASTPQSEALNPQKKKKGKENKKPQATAKQQKSRKSRSKKSKEKPKNNSNNEFRN